MEQKQNYPAEAELKSPWGVLKQYPPHSFIDCESGYKMPVYAENKVIAAMKDYADQFQSPAPSFPSKNEQVEYLVKFIDFCNEAVQPEPPYGIRTLASMYIAQEKEGNLEPSSTNPDLTFVASHSSTPCNSIGQDLHSKWCEAFGSVWMKSEWTTPLAYIQAMELGYAAYKLLNKDQNDERIATQQTML